LAFPVKGSILIAASTMKNDLAMVVYFIFIIFLFL